MFKRVLSAICAALITLALVACTANSPSGNDDSQKEKASDYVNKMREGGNSF